MVIPHPKVVGLYRYLSPDFTVSFLGLYQMPLSKNINNSCLAIESGMEDVSSEVEMLDPLDKSEIQGSLPLLQGLIRTGALSGKRHVR